jgi:hypothetical protein
VVCFVGVGFACFYGDLCLVAANGDFGRAVREISSAGVRQREKASDSRMKKQIPCRE